MRVTPKRIAALRGISDQRRAEGDWVDAAALCASHWNREVPSRDIPGGCGQYR